jgi:hypothetical protein
MPIPMLTISARFMIGSLKNLYGTRISQCDALKTTKVGPHERTG